MRLNMIDRVDFKLLFNSFLLLLQTVKERKYIKFYPEDILTRES